MSDISEDKLYGKFLLKKAAIYNLSGCLVIV